MEINLINTLDGLIPCLDEDYEAKKKLKLGRVYRFSVKLVRNYHFHKKYFALINCAWEFLTEAQQGFFKTKKGFRKTIEISAGHCEKIFSIDRREWIDTPLSISFDEMDEDEFEDLYSRVFDVILRYPLRTISREYFEKNLMNFIRK